MTDSTVADDVAIEFVPGRGGGGPASTRIVVAYGFWIFLLSDIIMFSGLFAAYAVLSKQTAGGPSGPALFDRGHVLIETGCLLASSFTCGLCSLAIERRNGAATYAAAAITFVLGGAFIALESSSLYFFGRDSGGTTPLSR